MTIQPEYIIYKPQVQEGDGRPLSAVKEKEKVYPMTPGVWQNEALGVLEMYEKGEGSFSPVMAVEKESGDPRSHPVPHKADFRFFTHDAARYMKPATAVYLPGPKALIAAPAPVERPKDVLSLAGEELYVPDKTELKGDQFPERLAYLRGGLYPAAKNDLRALKQHENAPNYRKMPDKPIHGVAQPTKQGFHDVLDHIGGKGKPVVWTNTRAEGVIYIEGKPYNLRALKSRENVDLEDGGSAGEIEALEEKLKQKLIARGQVEVVEEVPTAGEDGKLLRDERGRIETTRQTKQIAVTAGNCQTTKDVVRELQDEGYKIEYERIPISDEKNPGFSDLDAIRNRVVEMKKKYPDSDVQYVFNCHQGKGRTTAAMVAAGITLDGKGSRLELPIVGAISSEDPKKRADKNINENFHLQNLREVVDEYKKKTGDAEKQAEALTKKADSEGDPEKKAELQRRADEAEVERLKLEEKTRNFTKRYAMMLKYSEYVCEYGPEANRPTFEEWMNEGVHKQDLDNKWVSLSEQLGIALPLPGTPGRIETARA
ncbi:MAG: hypothetical protein HYU64_12265 [Armatimonadetes bacterium]|nr:hypothetical protein [Armatimonadota bacterium]